MKIIKKIIKIIEFISGKNLYLKLKIYLSYVMNNLNTGIPLGEGAPLGSEYNPGCVSTTIMDGGSMISGKWMNRRTGETIIVRDSIMDGENMILITNKGQLDMNNFSANYIQVSDEVYDDRGNRVGTQEVNTNEYCTDVMPDYGYENNQTAPKKQLNNFEVIDKIFTKIKSKPTIKFDIKWAKFPTSELQMLVNFLDVQQEDIVAYIVDKFVNQDEIAESLKTFVDDQMNGTKDKAK